MLPANGVINAQLQCLLRRNTLFRLELNCNIHESNKTSAAPCGNKVFQVDSSELCLITSAHPIRIYIYIFLEEHASMPYSVCARIQLLTCHVLYLYCVAAYC